MCSHHCVLTFRAKNPSVTMPDAPKSAAGIGGPERARARLGAQAWMLIATLASLGALFAILLLDPTIRERLAGDLSGTWRSFWRLLSTEFFFNPWFYAVIVFVLVLERLVPADGNQALLSRGARQDLVWVPFKLLVHASFVPTIVVLLRLAYDRYLGFLSIDAVAAWPPVARIALALLWSDFLFWLIHYIRHKVKFLWYFHAVHHSQKELNFFTEYRVHPLDDVFALMFGVIPILMVEHSFVTVAAIVWIRHWHTRICHANIRTNLGPLRYILVTPQSHRVHHSVEPHHHDTNFGLTFSIWDHLFGTQYRNYDEYPKTGINEADFPSEQEADAFASLNTLLSQLVYPFRAVARLR
jgi:sterol desaturase/sphingolipid hydroxylase (fatty acid hydroxylase superfamily)